MHGSECCFLGEKFIIPEETKQFVAYMREAETIFEEVLPILNREIKNGTHTGYMEGKPNDDFNWKYRAPLYSICEKMAKRLTEEEIYDISPSDFLTHNSGFNSLITICQKTERGLLDSLQNQIKVYMTGYNREYSKAVSSISGTGLSLYTNSPVHALAFSAVEERTIKKQIAKADAGFKKSLTLISDDIDRTLAEEEHEILFKYYYPGVADSLERFSNEVVSYFLLELNSHNKFDISEFLGYDLNKSDEILSNYDLAPDKKQLLRRAFEVCPYNPNVFLSVAANGFLDINTYNTADFVGAKESLYSAIDEFLKKNKDDVHKIYEYVKIISACELVDENTVLRKIYADDINKLIEYYNDLDSILNDIKKLKNWVERNLTDDANDLIMMDSPTLSMAIESVLSQNSVNSEVFSIIYGMVEKRDASCFKFNSIDKLIAAYRNDMTNQVIKLSKLVEMHVKECNDKINQVKIDADTVIAKRMETINEINERIRKLKARKSEISAVSFLKRKKIDEEIRKLGIQANEESNNRKKVENSRDEKIKQLVLDRKSFDLI